MTLLQFIHVVCAAVYLWIAGYVLWRAPRLQRAAGVAGIATCFAWWCASLLMAHDPESQRSQAVTAYDIGVVAWASFGSLALWFALAFAGKRTLLAARWMRALLVVPPLFVMIEQWRGDLAADYLHQSWGWSYQWAGSFGTLLFYLFYGAYMTAALAIVRQAGKRSTERLVRRQAAIIIYTAMVPFVCSTTTDVVLPWLGYHQIPNIAPAFLLAWTIGIAVAIIRYRLLELTPETAAEDILAAMSDGLLLVGRDGRVVAANPAATRMLGGGGDLRGGELATMIPSVAPTGAIEMQEIELASQRTLSVSRSMVRDPAGDAIGSICLFRDVTDRKHAEQALAAAHAQLEERVLERTRELDSAYHELQRVVRALGGLHATVDAIHKASGVREIGLGVARTLMSALDGDGGCRLELDGEGFHSDGFAMADAPLRIEIIASGKRRGALELHARAPSAPQQQVVARVALEIAQSLEGLALRHAVAQSDRLASIGVLAAGVAHEINNPLTYLTLGLYEIQDHLSQSHETSTVALRERADEALHGCERISKIVRELGSFARDGDDVRLIPVSDAVDGAIAMATHQIRHRARLIVQHGTTAPVRADLGRLTQVFLNLLVNAAHAIPDGNVDANEIAIETREEGRDLIITVRDTGRGIAAEDLPHVFEPFFSTKQVGEGSGLGLSISHKIARSLGGKISVESSPGAGAKFTVCLPRGFVTQEAGQAADAPSAATPISAAAPTGGQILIIDDDLPVARSLERLLDGHRVTVVGSGAEAKRLFQTDAAFELVICDVMMPDLNGPELHAWVRVHRPELAPRMVFVTGGAFTPETEAFLEQHRSEIVAKPFAPTEIHRLVAEMLRRARAS